MMAEAFSHDTPQKRALRAFKALVAGEDAAIDLALAALLIASSEYPDLKFGQYLAQLDSLALRVHRMLGLSASDTFPRLPPGIDLLDVITAINEVLFAQEGFHGNLEDYYNPSNSFLNAVLESRTGIPIALSLLYMEVGKRVGVQIDGIALPFHFVVSCRLPQSRVYIDPFEGGHMYSEEECRERVRRMLDGKSKIYTQWFEPISHKFLLVRMLNNLKHIYLNTEDYARALAVCDHILLLIPRSPLEYRDRGNVNLQLKHYGNALRDLSAYLGLAPLAEDNEEVRRQIKALRQIMAMMN